MRNAADRTVYDAHGQLALIIEIKNKLGTSNKWAAKMRRNILAHGLLPYVKLFLLALPDHFYLWKEVEISPEEVTPTYDINPEPFLKPYYEKAGVSLEQLSGESFELIISSWLSELKQAVQVPSNFPLETQKWLFESGFLEAVKDGRVESEVSS